jgi:CheY-like chemotaxis protein
MAARHDLFQVNARASESARVMIVDDDEFQGEMLSEILIADGYDTAVAINGKTAIDLYNTYQPDVVLMDVVMSGMDGYQVARELKRLYPDRFIPIIFITSLNSPESVVHCLESGGVDCIIKPYNPAVLSLKIKTYKDLAKIYTTVKSQRDQLEDHTKHLESSYVVAENVFNKVMQSDVLKSEAIKYFLSPIAIFNGDILLAAYRPSGELHVMLGDFTGHGLSAAIGAIPVSDIFYGMTEKGFSISEIIEEINNKLKRILPRGLFLAACLIEYSNDSRRMTVWNAGLPDTIIFNKDTGVTIRVDSKNYPLGINDSVSLTQSMDVYQLNKGDKVLMFTDGLVEAKNRAAEQYGVERVVNVIQNITDDWKLDGIYSDLVDFVGSNTVDDDITMIEINLDALTRPIVAKRIDAFPTPVANAEWKMNYCFGHELLRNVDPLPNIVQSLMGLQKLQRFKQDIFVILKELFVNALDHGLLKLDSTLKMDANGFSQYVQEREKRLQGLEGGIISIEILHKGSPDHGVLDFFVFDSGDGFDVKALQAKLTQESSVYHGRGLLMIRNICQSLEFNDKGNEVHARYIWKI